ncbi:MAG: hypothetical protein M3376_04515 [Actinomycetota bacterium]|nr:hypothetical protein [Actinomycetota bacterium]
MTSDRSPALRLRQGFVLLAGAVVFSLIVGSSPDAFYWTPLGIGLVYLASAVAGGRQGGYWSGALVLVGWGVAVAYARQARPELDIAGLYLIGAGLGATAAIAAQRLGIKADPLGAVLTVVVAGAILALSRDFAALTDARTYAALVAAVGLVNVIWALLADR